MRARVRQQPVRTGGDTSPELLVVAEFVMDDCCEITYFLRVVQ
jgi:hypothetical protein